jgi:tetratricopeptide (TPR) repeat protein
MSRGRSGPPRWGEDRAGVLSALVDRAAAILGPARRGGRDQRGVPLPARLRRGPFGEAYGLASRGGDHRSAGTAALAAAESAIDARAWWEADAWAHRALWHFERAEATLEAVHAARRIGDLRTAAGDPASARRYYAEAIDEARDIGAEREQGLGSLGLGRALLELGDVTAARRLADAAVALLERSGAPATEVRDATELRGVERSVGPRPEEEAK